MVFSKLAEYFEQLEKTSSRLSLIEHQEIQTLVIDEQQDPRFDEYTNDYYRRFSDEFPEFSTEQAQKAMRLSKEWAQQRITIEDSADNDQLTGLLSRKGLYKALSRKLEEYRRRNKNPRQDEGEENKSLTFLYLDLDDFKQVNKLYRHKTGDEVLNVIGQLLGNSVRPTDIVGRRGGEEFVILLDGTNSEGAIKVAERIRKEFAEACELFFPHLNWPKTVSIGINQLPNLTSEMLDTAESRYGVIEGGIHNADVAHQEGSKNVGKNKIGVMLSDSEVKTAFTSLDSQGNYRVYFATPEKSIQG